jgi:23S rRNA (cytosine1962-C5)-methyltransferase
MNHLWIQHREINPGKQKDSAFPICLGNPDVGQSKEFFIQEAGVQMKIALGSSYDYGIYTDMACVRSDMHQNFSHYWRGAKVLNLFSYSGIFSFQSIIWEAEQVTSVDNNEKSWKLFEENKLANNQTDAQHEELKLGVFAALTKLVKEKRTFDVIIVDPPPSFTDLKSKYSVEDFYRKTLPTLLGLLSPRGLFIGFCNKHKVTWKEFRTLFIESDKSKWKLEKEFQLQDDCPTIPNYPEGNYLKGVALAVKSEKRVR